jgi:hypothetical protein
MLCPMSRKKSDLAPPAASSITREEADRQARRIVDKILDKKNPIGRRAILEGLKHPELLAHMSREAGFGRLRSNPSFRMKLKSAIERNNRERLIELFADDLVEHPIASGKENEVVNVFGPQIIRKTFLQIAETLKGKPGKVALINPPEYPSLATLADSLLPPILKVLEERKAGNTRSIREYLEFWSEQFPEPCNFLLRHEGKLTELLNAKRLPKLAKKLETQARVIADSLAGCDNGVKFSTSIELVRQGRRMLRNSTPQKSAN